jgi:hypothetical protein
MKVDTGSTLKFQRNPVTSGHMHDEQQSERIQDRRGKEFLAALLRGSSLEGFKN